MRAAGAVLAILLLAGCAAAVRWDGSSPSSTPASTRDGDYRVRSGDTLYSIAVRHDLDYRDLARWNGIGNAYRIYSGQMLRLSPPSGERDGTVVARAPSRPPPSSPPASGDEPAPRRPEPEPMPPAGPVGWRWPLQGEVARRFAPPESKGIIVSAALGAPVRAAAPGRVVYSGNALKGYGELIIIKHDETWLSVYGHNRRRLAEEGQDVDAGAVIGEVGQGPQRQPMLHFEIRNAGQPTDPLRLLPRRDTY